MTGLFATLIAAAQGTAPAITHRPRYRFAAEDPLADFQSFDVQETEVSVAEPASRATESVQPRPASPSILPRETRPSVGPERVFLETSAPQDRAKNTTIWTVEPTETTRETLFTPEPPPQNARREHDARPVLGGERETSQREAAPVSRPVERDEPAPLLSPVAAPHSGPAKNARENAPTMELRIGRIVVTPPTPTTVSKAPSARPFSAPRAKPRQSLEDYLSQRRGR